MKVLRVVAPEGHEFEPSRDYRRDWLEAKSASVPIPDTVVSESGEAVVETGITDREVGAEEAEGPQAGAEKERGQRVTDDPLDVGDPDLSCDTGTSSSQVQTDRGPVAVADSEQVSQEALSKPEKTPSDLEDHGHSNPRFEGAISSLWNSVEERPGIAYHIARLLAEQNHSDPMLPAADLVAGAALADYVQSDNSPVVEGLRFRIAGLEDLDFACDDERQQDAVGLLLFCATLRPTLLAPTTSSLGLLRRVTLSRKLQPVSRFASVVANQADRLQGARLDPSAFSTALSTAAWQEKLESFSTRVHDWYGKAGTRHNKFAGARRVWGRWLHEDECLGELVRLISGDEPKNRTRVQLLVKRLGDSREFTALVNETDKRETGGRHAEIVGGALKQLQVHTQAILELSNEWLRLIDTKPNPEGFVESNLIQLRRRLHRDGPAAMEALKGFRDCSFEPLRAAARRAATSVAALCRLVNGDEENPTGDADAPAVTGETADTILSRDLLYVTEIELDATYNPTRMREEKLLDLLLDTRGHAPTMRVACERRLERGTLASARLACDHMEGLGDPEIGGLKAQLDRAYRRKQRELSGELEALVESTEEVFYSGRIGDDERSELVARIVGVKAAVDRADALDASERDLNGIKQVVEALRAKMIDELQNRFRAVVDKCNENDRARIQRSIEDGYLLAAIELISRTENEESIESSVDASDDPFRDFMEVIDGLEGVLGEPGGPKPAQLCRTVVTRGSVAGVSYAKLSDDDAVRSERLLKAWYELSLAKRLVKNSNALETALLLLGVPVRSRETVEAGRRWAEVALKTDQIRDRSLCPVPEFGSQAEGRYRLLLNWAPSVSEAVTRSIGSGANVPTIVLHFGRLGSEREKLRRSAIVKQRLFLVIDESLVLFLSARPANRLSAMFRCALPFAVVEPYVTTSGLVPPELFYGRLSEQRAIMDPFGTCFIYGGRQLGKTALLRAVERDFHELRSRRLAKWIDLKVSGIGSPHQAGDIWALIVRELRDLPVMRRMDAKLSTRSPGYADKVIDVIEQWVNTREDNRLLLLLDEADEFLAADAEKGDFRESARLKGLMDRTGRRFKVVLAGLHNVLRATERANHPLAHFGQPIRVGPLLSNDEWGQAQNLVREPLHAVGCRFEREELVTRILAQTNYYPSLIQLYGAELIRHFRESRKAFPYVVTSDDITTVYRDAGLRNAIRDRFRWTLHLDQRYEVIAFALASDLSSRNVDIERGVERRHIAETARSWWADGFEGTTDVEFNVLLEEMVGLGVLRSVVGGARYTLRNPNILLLLGTGEEIVQELMRQREVRERRDPSVVHPQYRAERHTPLRYAPLTHEQLGRLAEREGVTVVTGHANGNIDSVSEYLGCREPETFVRLPGVTDAEELRYRLVNLEVESVDVPTIVLVRPETQWSAEWLGVARGNLRKGIRLVFVADPERLWAVIRDGDSPDVDVDWVAVRSWDDGFVRVWLDDNKLSLDREQRMELIDVTGGWPVLLERFVRRRRTSEWAERIENMKGDLRRPKEKAKLLEDFGMGTTDARNGMTTLAEYAPFGSQMIEEIAREVDVSVVGLRRRVEWGERLGLLSLRGDEWVVNSLVARLLQDT